MLSMGGCTRGSVTNHSNFSVCDGEFQRGQQDKHLISCDTHELRAADPDMVKRDWEINSPDDWKQE